MHHSCELHFMCILGPQSGEIQEKLCDAVNSLVKHFCKPEKEVSREVFMYLFSFITRTVF